MESDFGYPVADIGNIGAALRPPLGYGRSQERRSQAESVRLLWMEARRGATGVLESDHSINAEPGVTHLADAPHVGFRTGETVENERWQRSFLPGSPQDVERVVESLAAMDYHRKREFRAQPSCRAKASRCSSRRLLSQYMSMPTSPIAAKRPECHGEYARACREPL